jgi:hypothetical protein
MDKCLLFKTFLKVYPYSILFYIMPNDRNILEYLEQQKQSMSQKIEIDVGQDHLRSIFDYVNSNLVHLEQTTQQLTYSPPVITDQTPKVPRSQLTPKKLSDRDYVDRILPLSSRMRVTTSKIGVSCIICLDPLMPNEYYRKLNCDHENFHDECIIRWLGSNQDEFSCPLCRRDQY